MQPPNFDENAAQSNQQLAVQVIPESSYGLYRRSTPSPIVVGSNNYNTTGRRPYRGSSTYRGNNPVYTNPTIYASDRSDVVNGRGESRTPEYDFPPYDGHHTVADGFQYYLKTHYHEEEKNPKSDKSVGSFGYVDPFGIRRVVYYKADPQNGFVHKKNNRYVGFNATPYDPLPLNSSQ